MRCSSVLIVLLCSTQIAVPSAQARNLNWAEHRINRFGLQLVYPANVFKPQRKTDRGDGELFLSADGKAKLLIGALENSQNHSPASYQKFIARQSYPGFDLDYSPVGNTWSVLSGERDGTMFYDKVIFTCHGRRIGRFALVYPVAERSFYDPIIERIEDSFTAQSKGC
jgi:hypothetical protein